MSELGNALRASHAITPRFATAEYTPAGHDGVAATRTTDMLLGCTGR
jgi:hypothetical protein